MVAAYMRISLARASGALFQLGIQMKYQTIVTAVAEGVAADQPVLGAQRVRLL